MMSGLGRPLGYDGPMWEFTGKERDTETCWDYFWGQIYVECTGKV